MIIEDIKNGVLDCNNQELFFKKVIKGLLINLNEEIKIRNISLPHISYGLGDELYFLLKKGYDHSKEPGENTNEDYIYSTIPRCMVNPQNIDILADQLSSPYTRGELIYQTDDNIYTLSAEFRRMPIKLSCELKYYTDTYTDMLELVQQIISKMMFVRVFNITYMGQVIKCSYKVPDSFQDEHTFEFSGDMNDNVAKTLSLSIEIETCMPVYNNKSVMNAANIITNCDPPKRGNAYNIN